MIDRTRQGGFTLLELLMVVIIIAILASIALPQYLRIAERSRAAEGLSVLAAVRSSELRYKGADLNNSYTVNLNSLDIDGPGPVATPWTTLLWTYTVNGAVVGSNTKAVRASGVQTGKAIEIDLDTGAVCSTNGGANIYGLPAVNGGCP